MRVPLYLVLNTTAKNLYNPFACEKVISLDYVHINPPPLEQHLYGSHACPFAIMS
jgi:hypothetical protein